MEQARCDIDKSQAPDPEDALSALEQVQTVRRCLKELIPQQRDAVLCRFYGDMKLAEIAADLGINEVTVRIHLKRALQRLAVYSSVQHPTDIFTPHADPGYPAF